MGKRHSDAQAVQNAPNASGVARTLSDAIAECRREGVDPRSDAACRLICHQLAYLFGMENLDWGWDEAMAACRATEPAST